MDVDCLKHGEMAKEPFIFNLILIYLNLNILSRLVATMLIAQVALFSGRHFIGMSFVFYKMRTIQSNSPSTHVLELSL